jgi:prepilin signal peptidase PulO-like enzyme (type II secretory pathway)
MEFWLVLSLFALMIASVVTMLQYRLPIILGLTEQQHPQFKSFNLFFPRSHCPHCAHIIAYYHNIPVISYLVNRGRCAYCHQAIAKSYLMIEGFYSFALIGFAYFNPDIWKIAAAAWFILCISLQIIMDLKYMILPDQINYLLLWSGLFINRFELFCPLEDAVYGAGLGYISLWGFYHLYAKLTGKHGFGYGDFKLFSALGAWIGVYQLLPCIILSAVLGIILGCVWIAKHRDSTLASPIPFGPALALAGLIILTFS